MYRKRGSVGSAVNSFAMTGGRLLPEAEAIIALASLPGNDSVAWNEEREVMKFGSWGTG